MKLHIMYKIFGAWLPEFTLAQTAYDMKHLCAPRILIIPWTLLLAWTAASAPELKTVLPPSLTHLRFVGECFFTKRAVRWHLGDVKSVMSKYVTGKEWEKTTPELEVMYSDYIASYCRLRSSMISFDPGTSLKEAIADNGL
jgi:hypothetical protein